MLRTLALAALFATVMSLRAAEISSPTLTGTWHGTWTDSRKEYNGSGGKFDCVAVADGHGGWNAEFSLGKDKILKAALKGKLESGEIVFDCTVNLGEFHGDYQFKGRVNAEIFSGEYSNPGEKGTFTMTRKK